MESDCKTKVQLFLETLRQAEALVDSREFHGMTLEQWREVNGTLERLEIKADRSFIEAPAPRHVPSGVTVPACLRRLRGT